MKIFTLIQVSVCAVVASALSQSAIGADLYASTASGGVAGELYTIDSTTGAVTQDIGPLTNTSALNYGMTGLAFDPTSGVLYGSTAHGSPIASARDQLVKIDPATAVVTPIGNFGLAGGGTMGDIAFDPTSGTLYGIGTVGGASLYSINTTTGAATIVGNSGFAFTAGGGIAISSAGTVYGAPGTTEFGSYDKTTGAYTHISTPAKPAGGGYGALAYNGSTLYGLNLGTPPHLVTIDAATGTVTDVAPTLTALDGIAFRPTVAAGVPGDYNSNGVVDEADYVLWRNSVGQATLPNRGSGITGNVGVADYNFWRAHFANTSGSGAGGLSNSPVPEPSSVLLLVVSLLGVLNTRRLKSK